MALKRYRADRAFDAFSAGETVELDPTEPWGARQIATGYLEELDEDEGQAADEPAVELDETSSDSAAPTAVEGVPDGQPESEGGAPAVARSRRRN